MPRTVASPPAADAGDPERTARLADVEATRRVRVDEHAPTSAVAPSRDDDPTAPRHERSRDASEPVAASRHGKLVGRYLLLQHIGAGGLGDVYSAFDTELERKVAIKLLRVDDAVAGTVPGNRRSRMLREAQAIAQVRHANVVVIHDVGDFGDDVFLAMELLDGGTIDRWLAARRRRWQEIRDVFVLAARGLAAAHRVGLVHRDFKPGNVMVGDDGRVTVLDFGLARADTGPSPMSPGETPVLLTSELTGADVILGTPQYMAPELGAGADASPRSDQFAFCVALYRCLWGTLPFTAESVQAYRAAAANGEILRAKARGVPAWLVRAIERGLLPDPAARHDDMDALVFAATRDRRRARRLAIAIVVGVPIASAAIAASVLWWRPEPTAHEIDQTRRLADEARAAATRGLFIYPPPDRPDEPTAIAKVLELEAIEGAAQDEGDRAALALRDEMADALVELGDRWFERPGGPPFAVDFYAAALVFDPSRDAARQRVTWSPGQLADLAAKAERGGFSEAELVAAEPLAVLADPDPERRREKLRTYEGREAASDASRSRLLRLIEPEPSSSPVVAVAPISARSEPASASSPPTSAIAAKPDASEPATRSPEGDPARAPDPKAAGTESDAGDKALRAGRLDDAAAAFHRALAHDRRDVRALSGLAEVYFERSEYRQAERFAKLATTFAPKQSAMWILLGDARVKLLQYADARTAYEKARGLGATAADARLDRLGRLVGG